MQYYNFLHSSFLQNEFSPFCSSHLGEVVDIGHLARGFWKSLINLCRLQEIDLY